MNVALDKLWRCFWLELDRNKEFDVLTWRPNLTQTLLALLTTFYDKRINLEYGRLRFKFSTHMIFTTQVYIGVRLRLAAVASVQPFRRLRLCNLFLQPLCNLWEQEQIATNFCILQRQKVKQLAQRETHGYNDSPSHPILHPLPLPPTTSRSRESHRDSPWNTHSHPGQSTIIVRHLI